MKLRLGMSFIVGIILMLSGILPPNGPVAVAATIPPVKFVVPVGIGISPSTGHAFVLQTYVVTMPAAGPQASWVSMLDARTSKLLKVIRTGTDGIRLLVDGRSSRVFVIHGGYSPQSKTSVTTIDAKSGKIVRQTPCGSGATLGPILASRLGRLFLVTNGPRGFLLHVLNTANGQHLREMALPGNTAGISVSETARLLYQPGIGKVRVFHAGTLKPAGAFSVPFAASSVIPDERSNRVLVVDGSGFESLNAYTVGSWKHVAGRTLGNGMISNVIVAGNRIFAASGGRQKGTTRPTPSTDGSISMLDSKDLRVLRRVNVGVLAGSTAIDAATHHLFVASGAHLHRPGDSLVTIVDSRTGAFVKETAVPATLHDLAVDSQHGLVYASAYGTFGPKRVRIDVAVLSATSGALLRTVDLGPAPAP